VVAEALNKIDGKAENRDLFIESVLKTELTGLAARQTVRLDDYGNPIYDVYIRQVRKNKDGQYWNVPIARLSECVTVLEYDPVAYMKQPPYSRTFQGIKA